MNNEIKEAEKRGYDKAVEALRSSDAFYYFIKQKDYIINLQWAYWLDIKKQDVLKD